MWEMDHSESQEAEKSSDHKRLELGEDMKFCNFFEFFGSSSML